MLLATPLRLADDMPGDAALIDAVAKGDRRVAVALYDRLRDTMSRALRRSDFDPADFDAKATDARQARARLDAALQRVYRDAAAGMTPAGRDKLGRTRRPGYAA